MPSEYKHGRCKTIYCEISSCSEISAVCIWCCPLWIQNRWVHHVFMRQRMTDRSPFLLSTVVKGCHGALAGKGSVGPARNIVAPLHTTALISLDSASLIPHSVPGKQDPPPCLPPLPGYCEQEAVWDTGLYPAQWHCHSSQSWWYPLHSMKNKPTSDLSMTRSTHSVSRVLSSPTSCTSNQPISWFMMAWKNFCLILCICLPAARHQSETWM